MKHLSWMSLVFVIGASAFSFGCTPSPEKVCTHVVEIMTKEMSDKGDKKKDKGDDEDKKKEFIADCVKKASKEKEEDPEGYKCSAKCAMDASKLDDFMACGDKCPNKKKKKGSSDDDDGDKKKKKGDDDD